MNNQPIGIFDSGIGGLTVTKEIIKQFPNESIIYLGDTARVPYGNRSKDAITKFAKELVNFLLKKNVKALVVACNTISSVALGEIEKLSPVPVIGVVNPTVEKASKTTKNKRIGIIGTLGTIKSESYENKLKELDPIIEVVSVSCPLLVPLVEEGLFSDPATKLITKDYLDQIKVFGADTLVLACTHYPLLLETIEEAVGNKITLIDSAGPTAESLKILLQDQDLLSQNPTPTHEFYVTDAPERVIQVASRFFGKELKEKIQKVSLS